MVVQMSALEQKIDEREAEYSKCTSKILSGGLDEGRHASYEKKCHQIFTLLLQDKKLLAEEKETLLAPKKSTCILHSCKVRLCH